MGDRFAGKVAFVTGGASGMGKVCAQLFASDGAAVGIADMTEDAGNAVASEITSNGGRAIFVKCNTADAASVEAAVKRTVDEFGRLDFGVNAAGIGGALGTTGEYGIADWQKVIDVNLTGVFNSCRYEIPEMKKAGGGVIVNISSILGLVGFGGAPAYTAAKHGVVGLTKVAALDHAVDNIRVVSVNPGFIETPMVTSAGMGPGTDAYNFIASKHAMNRFGQPEEVSKTILWLCSDEASFITGVAIPVEGGYIAQ